MFISGNGKPKKRMIRAAVGIMLTALLLVAFPQQSFLRADAKGTVMSRDSLIKMLEEELSDATAARKAAESEYKSLRKKYSSVKEKKLAIDNEIELAEKESEKLREIVIAYDSNIGAINSSIDSIQSDMDGMLDAICSNLRLSYEDGVNDFYSVIFTSDGLYDLLTSVERLQSITDHDKRLMEEYEQAYADLLVQKQALNDIMSTAASRTAELTESLRSLNERRQELDTMMKELASDSKEAEEAREEAEKEEEEFNRELEKRLAELKSLDGDEYTGGDFVWPLPSKYKKISSKFGNRTNPITGKPQFHQGIDIPAPNKTEIHSAARGIVTETGSHYANGKYVIIDHGGGMCTMYCHLSKILVQKGDILEQNELLGLVGTTGYSTGYHLHFTVYKDGTAVNPMNFYK